MADKNRATPTAASGGGTLPYGGPVRLIITVKTADGRQKKVPVNTTDKIGTLVESLAEKFDIYRNDLYHFDLCDKICDPFGNPLQKWLDHDKTALQESIGRDSDLWFLIRYFRVPKAIETDDRMLDDWFYHTRYHVVSAGTFYCGEDLAIHLAVLDIQASIGADPAPSGPASEATVDGQLVSSVFAPSASSSRHPMAPSAPSINHVARLAFKDYLPAHVANLCRAGYAPSVRQNYWTRRLARALDFAAAPAAHAADAPRSRNKRHAKLEYLRLAQAAIPAFGLTFFSVLSSHPAPGGETEIAVGAGGFFIAEEHAGMLSSPAAPAGVGDSASTSSSGMALERVCMYRLSLQQVADIVATENGISIASQRLEFGCSADQSRIIVDLVKRFSQDAGADAEVVRPAEIQPYTFSSRAEEIKWQVETETAAANLDTLCPLSFFEWIDASVDAGRPVEMLRFGTAAADSSDASAAQSASDPRQPQEQQQQWTPLSLEAIGRSLARIVEASLLDDRSGRPHTAAGCPGLDWENVNILEADFSGIEMDSFWTSALSLLLSKLPSCGKLSLSMTGLDNAMLAEVAPRGLSAMACLSSLDLSWNDIGNKGAAKVVEAVLPLSFLTTLNLSGNRVADAGAAEVARLVAESASLVELDVSSNDFSLVGVEAVISAIAGKCRVRHVDLSSNSKASSVPAPLLERLFSTPSLISVAVRDLGITASVAAEFLPVSIGQNRGLVRVDLSRNGVGKGSAAVLDRIFSALFSCPSLQELLLEETALDPVSGLDALGRSLAGKSGSLRILSVSGNDFSVGGGLASSFVTAVAEHPSLIELSLNRCSLTGNGLARFLDAFVGGQAAHASVLMVLSLAFNPALGQLPAGEMGRMLSALPHLRVVNLANCGLKPPAAAATEIRAVARQLTRVII